MIHLTRRVFTDLSIWMIGFGLVTGLVFPFFVAAVGIPSRFVLTPWFFVACITAGFLVGSVNIGLARSVVGGQLQFLAERMNLVADRLHAATRSAASANGVAEPGLIAVVSDDEIGKCEQAFNRLVQALAISLETEGALRVFSEMLASQLELGVLTERALKQLVQHTKADAGALLLENEGEVGVAFAMGIRSPNAIVYSDHVRCAVRTRERQIVAIPENVAIEGVLTDFRPREVLVDPILYKEVLLGVIVLAKGKEFSAEERNRLDLLQRELASALHNALLYDRLQRLAALDALTDVYNRRFGLARLHEEFARAVRSSSPVGLLMFDLDYFKRVNDTYGHLVGDRVLSRVARIARTAMREGDILVRYGGEEFIAILPAASKTDVEQVGERLRHIVEDASIAEGEQMIRLTVSIGGAAYPEVDVEDATALVKQADKALYAAKEAGRNRVIVT